MQRVANGDRLGDAPEDQDQQGGIQSLETGLQVLLALAQPGAPWMLKAIASAASMPPSKAHRYLVSFCRMGFVERDPANGRYRLGPAALDIGLAALAALGVVRLGSAALVTLRDEVDETVALGVWGSGGPTFVRLEEASRPVTVNVKAGSTVPLLSSATGLVFAAFLPRPVSLPFIKRELEANRRSHREGCPRSMEEVEALLDGVRRDGLARVTGQLLAGIHALSAPVFDHQGRLAAALTALGSAGAFDDDPRGRIGTELRATARRLSTEMGWRGSNEPP